MSGLGQVKVQTAKRFTAEEVSGGLDGKHNNSLVCVHLKTTMTEVRTDHQLRPTHKYQREVLSGREQKANLNLQDGIAILDKRALFTAQDFCIAMFKSGMLTRSKICSTYRGRWISDGEGGRPKVKLARHVFCACSDDPV